MSTAVDVGPATKECPFCKEKVLEGAVKCRYCQSRLDGAAAAPATNSVRTEVDGIPVKRVSYIVDEGLIHYLKIAGGVIAIIISVTAFVLGLDFQTGLKEIDAGLKEVENQRRQAEDHAKAARDMVEKLKTDAEAATRFREEVRKARTELDKLDEQMRDQDRVLEFRVAQLLAGRPNGVSEERLRQVLRRALETVLADRQGESPGTLKQKLDSALEAISPAEADAARKEITAQLTAAANELNRQFPGVKMEVPKVELIDDSKRDAYLDDDGKIYFASPQSSRIPDTAYYSMARRCVQKVAKFQSSGQPGSLSVSFADVLATLIKQKADGTNAETGDWVIAAGAGAWAAGEDVAKSKDRTPLRSMKSPGDAYKGHPALGDDPGASRMSDMYKGEVDNGGVHINCGIPDKAFYETAKQVGTEKAAAIWTKALGMLMPDSTFQDAANSTYQAAESLYGPLSKEQKALKAAWISVGLTPEPAGSPRR